MKYIRGILRAVLLMLCLMFAIAVIAACFIIPYTMIMGEKPNVGIVNLWFLFVTVIILGIVIANE